MTGAGVYEAWVKILSMRRLAWIAALAALLSTMPARAMQDIPPDVPCDGGFHLMKRFTRGRKTSVTEPTFADDKLWLLLGFIDGNGVWRNELAIWDGTIWTTEDVPQPQEGEYTISALDVTDDGVAWLAGSHQTDDNRPLVLKWDGSTWETTVVPTFGPDAPLLDIDMWSSEEGWAVGHNEVDQEEWTLTLRWNGAAWQHVDSPGKGSFSELRAVAMASPTDVWAAGIGGRPRIATHWNGAELQEACEGEPVAARLGYSTRASSPH